RHRESDQSGQIRDPVADPASRIVNRLAELFPHSFHCLIVGIEFGKPGNLLAPRPGPHRSTFCSERRVARTVSTSLRVAFFSFSAALSRSMVLLKSPITSLSLVLIASTCSTTALMALCVSPLVAFIFPRSGAGSVVVVVAMAFLCSVGLSGWATDGD